MSYIEPTYARVRGVKFEIMHDADLLDLNQAFVRNSNVSAVNANGSLLDGHLGSQS